MAIFGKQPSPPRTASDGVDRETPAGTSRLGPGLVIDGRLTGTEDVTFEGRFRGEIDLQSDLRVGPKAALEATIHARNVTVEGAVQGDISADQRVMLVSTATVEGNIRAPRIVVAEGAKFRGAVDMNAPREGSRKGSPKKDNEEKVHAANRG